MTKAVSASGQYAFFLGGRDLEMITIATLLTERRCAGDARMVRLHDAGLVWGARASAYRDAITVAVADRLGVVLVELDPDIPLPPATIEIDHHGPRSAEPSALRQVFDLLALPASLWTRDMALVAANDVGHVRGMLAMGASAEEMAIIRARDRAAQGITAEEEAAGAAALAAMQVALDGSLIIVHLPHGRSATVADPLALCGDLRDLLVFAPTSTQFFGCGARIDRLSIAFPGGWRGGALPEHGFWGLAQALSPSDVLICLS